MELKEIFCPECGEKIQVDITRASCFCSNCGNKIMITAGTDTKKEKNEERNERQDLEKKLEEAYFYIGLSNQKKEALETEKNPTYYLKAQDILIDLTDAFADDYRIWWELSKPLDYTYENEVNDYEGRYTFNVEYFHKALDKADIENKQKIIEQYECYEEDKKRNQQEYIQRQKKAEEERLRMKEEEERQYQKEEAEKRASERERQQVLMKQIMLENEQIWEQMEKNDMDLIDGSFFELVMSDGKKYTGVLRIISNVLYLMMFYEDKQRGITYREQSITVKVGKEGILTKYNGQPVRIKNYKGNNILAIHSVGYGKLGISDLELNKNLEYVNELMRKSKKPLMAGKILI